MVGVDLREAAPATHSSDLASGKQALSSEKGVAWPGGSRLWRSGSRGPVCKETHSLGPLTVLCDLGHIAVPLSACWCPHLGPATQEPVGGLEEGASESPLSTGKPCPELLKGTVLKGQASLSEAMAVRTGRGAQAMETVPPERHRKLPGTSWPPRLAWRVQGPPVLLCPPRLLLGQASGPHSLGGARPGHSPSHLFPSPVAHALKALLPNLSFSGPATG